MWVISTASNEGQKVQAVLRHLRYWNKVAEHTEGSKIGLESNAGSYRHMMNIYGTAHYILWTAGALLWAVMYVLLIVLEEVD